MQFQRRIVKQMVMDMEIVHSIDLPAGAQGKLIHAPAVRIHPDVYVPDSPVPRLRIEPSHPRAFEHNATEPFIPEELKRLFALFLQLHILPFLIQGNPDPVVFHLFRNPGNLLRRQFPQRIHQIHVYGLPHSLPVNHLPLHRSRRFRKAVQFPDRDLDQFYE